MSRSRWNRRLRALPCIVLLSCGTVSTDQPLPAERNVPPGAAGGSGEVAREVPFSVFMQMLRDDLIEDTEILAGGGPIVAITKTGERLVVRGPEPSRE